MAMTDLSALLDLAVKAAQAAGDELAARKGDFIGIAVQKGRDIKLNADRAAENLILSILREGSTIDILAEESGMHGTPEGLLWVVDPLDGSENYIRRSPVCAVSIALLKDGEPVLGVVHDFNMGETWTGGEGIPAKVNDELISVSAITETKDGMLMTGLPVSADYSPEGLAKMGQSFVRWRKLRMIGSAALSAVNVAGGRADCYSETGCKLWDVAAGIAIVRAAGGRALISDGAPDAPRAICIDNGKLPLLEPFA
ncbi:inositol monophosphatase [Hyphomonas sp. FCG-A18]|uniref:inositol monophosphatase family protein n=1 Tax=Hyphomonas sp. FCG-A18 TaxID=3080019 RepID=UPI002B27EF3E|nr:inositol monophosphatase [Hyphomonas sp. FCG-A18]